jgi:hypothetical protein
MITIKLKKLFSNILLIKANNFGINFYYHFNNKNYNLNIINKFKYKNQYNNNKSTINLTNKSIHVKLLIVLDK